MALVISFVPELKGLMEGFIVMPFQLRRYAGKWGHTWRKIDRCGKRWDDWDGLAPGKKYSKIPVPSLYRHSGNCRGFIILYIF